MDPFSITVGVAGLITLVSQTVKVTRNYYIGVKEAPKTAKELLKTLAILDATLIRLEKFLRDDETLSEQLFEDDSVLVSSIDACQVKLQKLHSKLCEKKDTKLSRLLWPLDEKEHKEALVDLRTFTQWIQLALTVDGLGLLSRTSENVVNVLAKQLESIQLMKEANARAQAIENSIKEQSQVSNTKYDAEERRNILEWISSMQYEKKHHAIRSPRVEGTGQWLLAKKEFQRWRDDLEPGPHNVLWAHGIQGSGKSVLSSLIIDTLRDGYGGRDSAVVFMYCDYREQASQEAHDMVASLTRQLAESGSTLPDQVAELYDKFGSQGKTPQFRELEEAFLATSKEFHQVFVVIDALDECDGNTRRNLLKFLCQLQQSPSIKLLVTSRPHPQDIKVAFENASQIRIEARDADLRAFLAEELENSRAHDIIDEEFRTEIVDKIVDGAQKMFLLPALQIQRIIYEPTAGEMADALDEMPVGLQEAFEDTIQRINQQQGGRKTLGIKTLMWISHAKRPLTVLELSEALAIRSKKYELDPRYRPSQKLMIECCLGLVTVDEETSQIRLVHYSVQEYLQAGRETIFPSGDDQIAESCLTYLLLNAFSSGCCAEYLSLADRLRSYPLLPYVSVNWGHHIERSTSPMVKELVNQFLDSRPKRAMMTQAHRVTLNFREKYWTPDEANSHTALHVTAHFGLYAESERLISSKPSEIDIPTHIGTTALILAAARGFADITLMLLRHGADVTCSNWYGTALHCAAEAGKCDTIKVLLQHGMDVNILDDWERTPLFCAVDTNQIAAAELLLDNGANMELMASHDAGTFLESAILERNVEMLRMLLSRGVKTNMVRERDGMTALSFAVCTSSPEAVSLLLEYGAKVEDQGTDGQSPIHYAVRWGDEISLQLLIEKGAEVDAKNHEGNTPLGLAIEFKHRGCQEILLDHGARIVLGPMFPSASFVNSLC